MSDRVRESLFAVLEPRISGSRFADLCAGSGAAGIEALSRGAKHAHFIEQSRDAVAIIEDNLANLKLTERATLLGADVATALVAFTAEFDLIVADPPYHDDALATAILSRCAAPGSPLADDGILALTGQTQQGAPPLVLPKGLRCVRTLIYGDNRVDLLARDEGGAIGGGE